MNRFQFRPSVEILDSRLTPSVSSPAYTVSSITSGPLAPSTTIPQPPPSGQFSNADQLWVMSDPNNPTSNGTPLSGLSVDGMIQRYFDIVVRVNALNTVELPAAKNAWEVALAAFKAEVMANQNGDPIEFVMTANRLAYQYMRLGELQCDLVAEANAIKHYLMMLDFGGYLTPAQSILVDIIVDGVQLEQNPAFYSIVLGPADPMDPFGLPTSPGFGPVDL